MSRVAYRVLVGKPKGQKHKHDWEDNIRMGLKYICWMGVDTDKWGGGGFCEGGNEPLYSIKFGAFFD